MVASRDGPPYNHFVPMIFEQLLLAASRSPQRLKAIDDVIQQLRKEEGEQSESNIVPHEFMKFWEAFKQSVPQQKRRKRT